ncbi:MAG TPA: DNA polymerase III subunit delta' [Vicinamibacterales bacterium]|nr:DNA polymerase III subunit delta' [Vicinamibacterales bacterium]
MPFRSLAGHRSVLALLARAISRQSLPQSVIFAGPEGVGKYAAAVALAQALNCEQPIAFTAAGDAAIDADGAQALDACGDCGACRRIARGVHADVLSVTPGDTGAIKVDQVREAIERAAYRPFEGRRRVVIVDEADALLPEAQNALLKTLEEPPPASVFVLVTARPDMLLPTVRSRCQRLRFGPLVPAEIAALLMRDHGYGAAEAHAAASASAGSVGRALEGGTDEFVAARDAAAELLEGVASTQDPRRRLASARALISVGRSGADRDELMRRLRALSSLLRDVGILLCRADDRALANADLKPRLAALLRSFDGDRALRAFSAVDRALSALDRHASPKIVADWLAFQI